MRVFILSINYWPEMTGIGALTTYRAEYLASAGHDVTVVTTFPYYPEWSVQRAYRGKLWLTESRNGVRILRGFSFVPKHVTSVKRVVHEASFIATSLMRAVFQKRPELLLVVSPPLGLALSAILLSRLWRIPYVFDVEDLQPDAAAALGMLPSWALRVMYRVERVAYQHASLVSTLTKGMRDKITKKGVPQEKTTLFEPRADESLANVSADEGAEFREQQNLNGNFIVTHSGNIGIKQGLDIILDVAAITSGDEQILYLIVGDGAARERLEARAAEQSLRNVRFLPLLDSRGFRGLLAASDICLVTQKKFVSDNVFPSKTVTYLAAGCAVIASANASSEISMTIRDSGGGLVVEPENPQALRDAIYALRGTDLENCRQTAREYASRRWSSARVLGSFERSLVAIAAQGRGSVSKLK